MTYFVLTSLKTCEKFRLVTGQVMDSAQIPHRNAELLRYLLTGVQPPDHRNYESGCGYLDGPNEEESGRIPDGRRTPVVRRSARGTGSRDRRWRSGSCLSCLDPSRQLTMGIGECDFVRRNRATRSRRKSPTSHRLGLRSWPCQMAHNKTTYD